MALLDPTTLRHVTLDCEERGLSVREYLLQLIAADRDDRGMPPIPRRLAAGCCHGVGRRAGRCGARAVLHPMRGDRYCAECNAAMDAWGAELRVTLSDTEAA